VRETPNESSKADLFSLTAVVLVTSGAAHAETFGEVMQSWAGRMSDALENFQGAARESQMKEITKGARDRLSKVSCKTEDDASRTPNIVSTWKTTKKLPIVYTYKAICNLKTQLLVVEFAITQVIPDSRQDVREDANNVLKLIGAAATWGQAMRKAVDDIHEQNKLKEQIDTVTGVAIKAFAQVPCRHSSDVSVSEVVADVVARQKLQIEYSASGQCDSAKHTWQVDLKVSKFTVAFDPKKDTADTNFLIGHARRPDRRPAVYRCEDVHRTAGLRPQVGPASGCGAPEDQWLLGPPQPDQMRRDLD
jgi:hypothetical protein